MDLLALLAFLAGLTLLIGGAELLVRGASRLAQALGVSPLVVGLTVVACATSAPELAIGLQAAWSGEPDLALGNVLGSNIANVLLILGLAALVRPLPADQALVRVDVPVMLLLSALAWLIAVDGRLAAADGTLLLVVGAAYLTAIVRAARRTGREVRDDYDETYEPPPAPGYVADLLLVAGGLLMLVGGVQAFMYGAEALARSLGVSPMVIGLTLSAVGTSAPEVATSVVASYRGAGGIAVGNVIGSNVINLGGVLGLTALIAPGGLAVSQDALAFGFPVMVAVAALMLPVLFIDSRVARGDGAALLAAYVLFTAVVVRDATGAQWAPAVEALIATLLLPAAAIALVALSAREAWQRRLPVARHEPEEMGDP